MECIRETAASQLERGSPLNRPPHSSCPAEILVTVGVVDVGHCGGRCWSLWG